jgi:hypothetical protein
MPAMKRFADSLARQKAIKLPPGYKTSMSICCAFRNQHAPKKADAETAGKHEPKPVSLAQREKREACEPSHEEINPSFITRQDVNGGHVDDYILDYGKFICGVDQSFSAEPMAV